ncbi:DUF6728 family protein [Pontibacter sp. G13]|uniref:DUF6728 family protein n=1 Tax=Pontibacter sp. G13 TaxID=3074898 RepID=UPI00288B4AD0|nr:DUF6728 family protein [Pontibacter sp. G13]WNJ16075.1 DUF6728 family protein [Pontibacter sp. G13]
MEVWKKIWGYITFKKADPDAPSSFNLKVMHGINRISLLMFFIAVTAYIIKVLLR